MTPINKNETLFENISLIEYEEAVKKLAKVKSAYVFPNQNAQHAGIVLKTMLNNVKDEFRIFDDDLSGDVSGQAESFLNDLRKFGEAGKTLKLVVKDKTLQGEIVNVLREMVAQFPNTIQVKQASPSFLAEIEIVGEELTNLKHINFAVGDKNAFRLEFPAGSRVAFCSFNNENYPIKLLQAFDKKFESCKNYFDSEITAV